jgi:hypothetical protein
VLNSLSSKGKLFTLFYGVSIKIKSLKTSPPFISIPGRAIVFKPCCARSDLMKTFLIVDFVSYHTLFSICTGAFKSETVLGSARCFRRSYALRVTDKRVCVKYRSIMYATNIRCSRITPRPDLLSHYLSRRLRHHVKLNRINYK